MFYDMNIDTCIFLYATEEVTRIIMKLKKKLKDIKVFQQCDTPLVARGASREGSGSVGSVKGPFDVCRRLNAPPAGPAPLIISNFPVICYLYRYLFVQFHARIGVSHLGVCTASHYGLLGFFINMVDFF